MTWDPESRHWYCVDCPPPKKVAWDSSAPMSPHQRTKATNNVRQLLDDYSLQLSRRYKENAAAGRYIDDDGDEHGCPTKGSRKGCRLIQEELVLEPDDPVMGV